MRDFRLEAVLAYTDELCLRRLPRRAVVLGYDNLNIRTGLQQAEGHAELRAESLDTALLIPLANWRGGKPFARTLLALEKSGFLPNLD